MNGREGRKGDKPRAVHDQTGLTLFFSALAHGLDDGDGSSGYLVPVQNGTTLAFPRPGSL